MCHGIACRLRVPLIHHRKVFCASESALHTGLCFLERYIYRPDQSESRRPLPRNKNVVHVVALIPDEACLSVAVVTLKTRIYSDSISIPMSKSQPDSHRFIASINMRIIFVTAQFIFSFERQRQRTLAFECLCFFCLCDGLFFLRGMHHRFHRKDPQIWHAGVGDVALMIRFARTR